MKFSKFSGIGKVFSFASVLVAGLGLNSSAYQAPVAAPAKVKKAIEAKIKTDFIRVHRDDGHVYLQTGITRFTKGDMEERITKLGFKQTQHRWFNAWKIEKK